MTKKKTPPAPAGPSNPFTGFLSQLAPVQDVEDTKVWDFIPPGLAEFITSEAYLGLPPLSARQLKALSEGFVRDGTEFFESAAGVELLHEILLIWGKGSGKDYVSAIVISYISYVVLCLHDPQRYFRLAPRSNIDIVNVATRQEQANDVFFAVLEERLRRPCFRQWRPRFTKAKVIFAGRHVRVHSLHSKAQKWEGYNILAWVMDEADGFQTAEGNANARATHTVLQSSAISRFPGMRWIGLIISYPRSELGFVLEYKGKADAAALDGHPFAYVDFAATWEVHPHYDPGHPFYQDFPWVTLHGKYRVPAPYRAPFENDPTDAAMTYLCQPPPTEGAFFEYPDLLDDIVVPELPLVWATERVVLREVQVATGTVLSSLRGTSTHAEDWDGIETRRFTALGIARVLRHPPADAQYFGHGDPGEVKDSFAFCLARALPEQVTVEDLDGQVTYNKVAIDLLLEWKPAHNQPVDYLNVGEVILRLCELFPVLAVSFDKFNSAATTQTLMAAGITCRQLGFSNAQQLAMYKAFKALAYNRLVTVPEMVWPGLRKELRYLVCKNGTKITHDPKIAGKDLADAAVAATWFASGAALGRIGREVLESTYGAGASAQIGYIRKKLSA